MAVKAQSSIQLFDRQNAEFAQKLRYKYQRNISAMHLETLKMAMIEGSFSPVNTIMFAQVANDNACINGQHTMQAIIETGCAYSLPTVQYYCDTEQERAQLYYRIDKQRRRVIGDSVRSLGLPEKINLTPTQIKVGIAALRYIRGNWGVNRNAYVLLSDDHAISILPHWVNDINDIYDAISPCGAQERSMILKKSVFPLALVTMHYSREKAFLFWRQVAQDDGLERWDARKTIRGWLLDKAKSIRSFNKATNENEVSRGVALAWNAFYENRTLRYIGVKDTTKNIQILGTPYNGAQDKDFLPEWSKFDFGISSLDVRSVA